MERLKISVVIPTYKRPALLERCLNALMEQTFPSKDFEIIVVSDGPDDTTGSLLESMPCRKDPSVRYYALPANAGPAAARNFGWTLAQADLVAFTDDDCIPSDQWLSAMWNAYQSVAETEVAFTGKTVVPLKDHPTDYERNISQLATAEFITANCASTKYALERVRGFDERFKMAWREDSDLQFKYIVHGIPIRKVADAVVTHPVRKAPWGISIREEKKGMFNELLYKKYPQLYREKIESDVPWHYYGVALFLALLVSGTLADKPALRAVGFAGWLGMTLWFAYRRLQSTSHSLHHISEMLFTSALIPPLSIFWKLYGSWKFKVFRIPWLIR